MRLMIVGSKDWQSIDAVWREIAPERKAAGGRFLISYAEEGRLAKIIDSLCRTAGIDQAKFPLNEAKENPEDHRIRLMIAMARPELLLAFHPFIKNSKITRLAVDLANGQEIPTRLISK